MPETSISIWEFLASAPGAALLGEDWAGDSLAAVSRLRKRCTPEQASAVYSLWQVRRKAAGKLPTEFSAASMMTDRMLQQASSWRLASWLGGEFLAAGCAEAWDLCSSMGINAFGLTRAGLDVTGVDCDEAAVFCATHNAAILGVTTCEFRAVRVEESLGEIPTTAWVHIDPDRRASGKRSAALADCSPGEEILRRVVDETAGGAMKLSPAMGWGALAEWPVKIEYLSEAGVCRQLLAWWGDAASNRPARCATLISGDMNSPVAVRVVCADASPVRVQPVGAYLYELDAAVIAAGGVDDLAAELDLWRVDSQLEWLSGDAIVGHPAVRGFAVIGECPARPRDIRAALREVEAGEIAVKPRGVRVNTSRLQRELRGSGERPVVLFWGSFGRKERCILADRIYSS
jgi:hypothetical protein